MNCIGYIIISYPFYNFPVLIKAYFFGWSAITPRDSAITPHDGSKKPFSTTIVDLSALWYDKSCEHKSVFFFTLIIALHWKFYIINTYLKHIYFVKIKSWRWFAEDCYFNTDWILNKPKLLGLERSGFAGQKNIQWTAQMI